MGARLSFFRGFAADILVILSVDSGQFAGGLGLAFFELKLYQDFSIHPHPYTFDPLISNPSWLHQESLQARSIALQHRRKLQVSRCNVQCDVHWHGSSATAGRPRQKYPAFR
jgi:hypothetical protein